VIPVYNHGHAIGSVVDGVLAHDLSCILVDDASDADCAQVIDRLAAHTPARVTVVRHTTNQGKGGAVLSGLARAAELGFTHALQIDADGQHDPAQIPAFLAAARANPGAIVTGQPVFDASVPRGRLYSRYLTHVMVWINTLSFDIRDSMCGFRVYPIARVLEIARSVRIGRRMDFDVEVLVRLHWAGVRVVSLPTPVRYPLDGVSHFRLWWDNVLITRVHTALFFGMLARLPRLVARHWSVA
jgi:glycosyltransferase involved in cell wall biosynthesis